MGSALVVVALLGLGGWRMEKSLASTGCLNDPDAPTCVNPATLAHMTNTETTLFNNGISRFMGRWIPTAGLGPVFTQDSCVDCHSTPVGGGSAAMTSPTLGATSVTHFGTINPDGSFNPLANEGGDQLQPKTTSHQQGMPSTCNIPGEVVPQDATVVVLRATPPTFGDGLIDAIPDSTILANVTNQANSSTAQQLGIHGQANMAFDVPTGTTRPGRFGWKAQVPSLLMFVADALTNEIGATNPITCPNCSSFFQDKNLPQGQPIPSPQCIPTPDNSVDSNATPNDPQGFEIVNAANFLRFSAPHSPGNLSPAAQAGQVIFNQINCSICHVPSMRTASKVFVPTISLNPNGTITKTCGPPACPTLSNQTANLYSDLLIHDMGPILADQFPQGQAVGSQWRTTPLWGLSLKPVLLHDGRTSDLTTAIMSHGGEAALVVDNFSALSASDQANLLAFLGSL